MSASHSSPSVSCSNRSQYWRHDPPLPIWPRSIFSQGTATPASICVTNVSAPSRRLPSRMRSLSPYTRSSAPAARPRAQSSSSFSSGAASSTSRLCRYPFRWSPRCTTTTGERCSYQHRPENPCCRIASYTAMATVFDTFRLSSPAHMGTRTQLRSYAERIAGSIPLLSRPNSK